MRRSYLLLTSSKSMFHHLNAHVVDGTLSHIIAVETVCFKKGKSNPSGYEAVSKSVLHNSNTHVIEEISNHKPTVKTVYFRNDSGAVASSECNTPLFSEWLPFHFPLPASPLLIALSGI